METCFIDFVSERIQEIVKSLPAKNGEYASVIEMQKQLLEVIDPILKTEGSLQISHGDILNFRDFLEYECTVDAILQQSLYRQGYLDCVTLLKELRVLS